MMIFAPWIWSASLPNHAIAMGVIGIFGFVLGACLGSFAHATGQRLVRNISLLTPSQCDHCQRKLSPWMNAPVLGWLASLGRCRYCQNRLPLSYLISELILGSVIAFLFITLGTIPAGLLAITLTMMWSIMVSDAETLVVDLRLIIGIALLGLAVAITSPEHGNLSHALLGGIIAPIPLILADRLYRSIRQCPGFGEGDIWLLAALGLWTGPWGGAIIFVMSAWLGVGIAVYAYVFHAKQIAVLPFGVLLGISFITYIIAGLVNTLLCHNIL